MDLPYQVDNTALEAKVQAYLKANGIDPTSAQGQAYASQLSTQNNILGQGNDTSGIPSVKSAVNTAISGAPAASAPTVSSNPMDYSQLTIATPNQGAISYADSLANAYQTPSSGNSNFLQALTSAKPTDQNSSISNSFTQGLNNSLSGNAATATTPATLDTGASFGPDASSPDFAALLGDTSIAQAVDPTTIDIGSGLSDSAGLGTDASGLGLADAGPLTAAALGTYLAGKAGVDMVDGNYSSSDLPGRLQLAVSTGGLSELAKALLGK